MNFSTILRYGLLISSLFSLGVSSLSAKCLTSKDSSFPDRSTIDTLSPKPEADSLTIADRKQTRGATILVAGSSVGAAAGLYIYLQKAWWAENSTNFHFDEGRDLRYANNLDKMGHLMGGIIVSDIYYDLCRGLGMNDKRAAWWGFGMGTGLQLAIEIKDGFAPDWGFSVPDIAFGAFGSLMPLLKQKSPFFKNTDFKFSYWRRSDKYFDVRALKPGFHIDDYLNQTYWMTTSLRYLTGNRVDWIPDWLGLSIGWGIEAESWNTNPADPGSGGKPEFYISPDIDLVRLFNPKRTFWKMTLKRLNYLKIPLPTLQLTQKVRFWPVYY